MEKNPGQGQPHVLIIGLDGATFDLIRPWVAEGKLPTFQRLLEDGVQGELESIIPPLTPPAWTSFMTGVNPGRHGLFNFIEHTPYNQSIHYTNATSRKAPTIWALLSRMGWRVGVVNLPMTYPPEEVNGYCISGLDTPDEDSEFVSPAWLKKELKEALGGFSMDLRHLGNMTTDEKRDSVLESLVEIEEKRTKMVKYLIKNHPVDVLMVAYTAIDTAQHFFWHFMDPDHPLYDPVGAPKYKDAILNIYRRMDSDIAELLAAVPTDCTVILVSDHGGGPVSSSVIYLNRYLEELGLLTYKKRDRWGISSPMINGITRKVDDYLRGMLSHTQKAWLAKAFPRLREKWDSQANAVNLIDWEKTKAYSLEFLSFPSEIWINQEGKTPYGRVKAGKEYEEVIEFLTRQLCSLKDDRTGRPLIPRIYRKEEVYNGPYLDRAPDLILSWWEEKAFQVRRSIPGEAYKGIQDCNEKSKGAVSSWSATHRLHGILLMKGKPFRRKETISRAHIMDMAPTLFYLLGVPVPPAMEGNVLTEAFCEAFLTARPICESGQEDEDIYASCKSSSQAAYTTTESEKIQERLKGLGYME